MSAGSPSDGGADASWHGSLLETLGWLAAGTVAAAAFVGAIGLLGQLVFSVGHDTARADVEPAERVEARQERSTVTDTVT